MSNRSSSADNGRTRPTGERIAVIGAGSVGATICYVLKIRGLARQLLLVDINRTKARGEVLDINHGAMFTPPVEVADVDLDECTDCELVIITAGAKQKPGQSRLELASTNTEIFRSLIPQILSVSPDALLLVVSNPVDVLTYVAGKLSQLPSGRVIGSGTVLDSSRLRFLLARRLEVAVGNVHAYVIGEHGDSELVLWSQAHVGSIRLKKFRPPQAEPITDEQMQQLFEQVRSAAGQVIAAKGATFYAIALAVARIVEAIKRDERAVLTVSSLLDDYYGISDVCLSVPSLVGAGGVIKTLAIEPSPQELSALRQSAAAIRGAIRQVGF